MPRSSRIVLAPRLLYPLIEVWFTSTSGSVFCKKTQLIYSFSTRLSVRKLFFLRLYINGLLQIFNIFSERKSYIILIQMNDIIIFCGPACKATVPLMAMAQEKEVIHQVCY